jgi:hypothetical protein
MLTIGNGTAGYATLHRTIAVVAGVNALGTLQVAQLSADERAWLVDINTQRATVAYPTSFANLDIDEYAEEQARAEAAAIVAGTDPYGDPTEEMFASDYMAEAGSMYVAGGAADLVGTASAYLSADAAWFAEKANCPNGSWQGCPFADNTGHYINLAQTTNVWIGLGESTVSYLHPPEGAAWAYDAIIPGDNNEAGPESRRRGRFALGTRPLIDAAMRHK